MAFHIIHDNGRTFEAYLSEEEGELLEYSTWPEANTAISENSLISAFVVEAQLTEPVKLPPQNVDDAEIQSKLTEYDTRIQEVVESVGIPWISTYNQGAVDNMPPFLAKHSAEQSLYVRLVTDRAGFANLIS